LLHDPGKISSLVPLHVLLYADEMQPFNSLVSGFGYSVVLISFYLAIYEPD